MIAYASYADRRPFLFALAVLLAWVFLTGLSGASAALLLGRPATDPLIQSIGTLTATAVLLWESYRVGWLRAMGITRFGTWQAWVLTLLLGVYVALTGIYAYFGEISFDLSTLAATPAAQAILLRQLEVGFVEETMFRGFILFVLARAWGRTRRGLIAALLVQAALFGLLHSLQILAGSANSAALANVLATFVFGLWAGALVLLTGSLWPAVLMHFTANAFPMIKGLSSAWIDPAYLGYLRNALFDLPLVLLGLWLVLRQPPAEVLKVQEATLSRSAD